MKSSSKKRKRPHLFRKSSYKIRKAQRQKYGESFVPSKDIAAGIIKRGQYGQFSNDDIPNHDILQASEPDTLTQSKESFLRSWWKTLPAETKMGIGAVLAAGASGIGAGLAKKWGLSNTAPISRLFKYLAPDKIRAIVQESIGGRTGFARFIPMLSPSYQFRRDVGRAGSFIRNVRSRMGI